MRSARPISIPSATGTPRIPPSPHRRRSPSDPPPIAAVTTVTAQELGVRAGGGGYFYFVLFVCLAGGIWLLARSPHNFLPRSSHDFVVIRHSYVHNIRSTNQDDTDGTSSIVLPCPSS
jgi:hypothetical protein